MSRRSRASWGDEYEGFEEVDKLRQAQQPPLSRAGAPSDADRARRPALVDPASQESELNPGDRVEGLANFGRPTGEYGTVERTNQDDAVVKLGW